LFYLLAAILTSSAIVITFKVFERWRIDTIIAITVNYLVASLLGFWLCSSVSSPLAAPGQDWFPVALLTGIMLILTFFLYASSAQKVGVAITSVSGKMSVVIPVLLGFIWFREAATWNKIAGIVVALLAFWLTFRKDRTLPVEKKYFFLPVLLLLGNGILDSLLKMAEGRYIKGDFIFFLSTAFFVSLIIGMTLLIIQSVRKKRLPDWKSLLAGVFLGILNWYSTYFFLVGLRYFDVSLFVPVFNVSIVTTGALAGFFIFREQLRIINWIGIALAVCAILLMAVS
jgi:drug/metabolite transporter (DMT)-like permease